MSPTLGAVHNKCERLFSMLDTSYPDVSAELFENDDRWILIQRKVTGGSVSFNQNWASYKNGFGTASSDDNNYWLGLEHVYRLVQLMGTHELKIQVGQLFRCVQILSGSVKTRIMPLPDGENNVTICNIVWIQ